MANGTANGCKRPLKGGITNAKKKKKIDDQKQQGRRKGKRKEMWSHTKGLGQRQSM